jgi:hypothetical protein
VTVLFAVDQGAVQIEYDRREHRVILPGQGLA